MNWREEGLPARHREEAEQESPLRADERMDLGPRTMGRRLRSEQPRPRSGPGAREMETSPAFGSGIKTWSWIFLLCVSLLTLLWASPYPSPIKRVLSRSLCLNIGRPGV